MRNQSNDSDEELLFLLDDTPITIDDDDDDELINDVEHPTRIIVAKTKSKRGKEKKRRKISKGESAKIRIAYNNLPLECLAFVLSYLDFYDDIYLERLVLTSKKFNSAIKELRNKFIPHDLRGLAVTNPRRNALICSLIQPPNHPHNTTCYKCKAKRIGNSYRQCKSCLKKRCGTCILKECYICGFVYCKKCCKKTNRKSGGKKYMSKCDCGKFVCHKDDCSNQCAKCKRIFCKLCISPALQIGIGIGNYCNWCAKEVAYYFKNIYPF